MGNLENLLSKFIVIFATLLDFVSSLPAGSLDKNGRSYEEVIFIVSVVSFISLLMVVVGCLNWRNWKLCQRFGFNQMECGHSSNQIVQFPDSFNPDCSVTFDSLPDIQVSIPGSPMDILEKYFFPKIYTEKNLTRIDAEKEVELLMKTLKNKNHVERLNIETTKEIGKGWFGPVMNGTLREGSRSSKCIVSALNELAAPSQVLNYFKETAAYREIKHTNVLKMMFANIDTIPFWTVLEFCHLGDLKSYLVAHRVAHESISQKGLLIKFAADMAAGLNALHDHKYVHRDFAIRNCLVSSDLTIKIGDYGISFEKFKDDYFQWGGFFIPLRWLAPETFHYADETFNLRKMTKLANIWSFGVAIWELISFGMLPFPDLSNEEVLNQSKDGNLKKFFNADNLHKNSEKLAKVMNNCLEHAPKRPTLQSVMGHLLALKSELTPDYLSLMKDTLSNCGSPCEFVDVEDAFVTDFANENFNFDSIALSFEPASDDDFDIGFNARSSSSLDLKRALQSSSQLDGDLIKTTSFDGGMHLPDEKFHESVKLYYEDMLKRHQSKKYTVDSSPVPFKIYEVENVEDEVKEAEMNASEVNEFKNHQESSDCSDVILRVDEQMNIGTNKTLIVISPSDIHNHECHNDVNLILPLSSNSDPKINVDESPLSSNNLHSNLQATGYFNKINHVHNKENDPGSFNNLQERHNAMMQEHNKLENVQIENSKEVGCSDDQSMISGMTLNGANHKCELDETKLTGKTDINVLFPDKLDEPSNAEVAEQLLVGPPLGFEDIFTFKPEEIEEEKENIPFEHVCDEKIKI